jgi:eukaryotic-like serine/threonine-protein kinase
MPGPATAEELLQLVERSQVADRPVIQKAYSSWRERAGSGDEPARFAQHLIEAGVITSFHAEQLLAGRYKGFRVGAYRILRLIGVGGMGRVYLAEHAFMKRRVALKVLPKSQNKETSAIERFQREAQAVAALNHPNIVHAYDSGQEGDVYFLAMEYVAGESVQDYVKKFGRVPWPYAADFIRQAAEGLQHAADNGLVHRDIKPGNLLVDLSGTVKLLDLGLAMFFTEQVEGDPLTLRYNENVLGTADYLAPEQAVDSHNIDIRADIYSLGGTLYYLLSGHAPFPMGTIAQKLLWHQQKEPESITAIIPEAPKGLEAVLRKMMAKRPEDRYATAAEAAAALIPFSKPHPKPFPEEAAQQYDAIASRQPTRSGIKAAPASPRPPAASETASGASSRVLPRPSKPASNIPTRLPKGVESKPRSATAMAATAAPADTGLDFLRVDVEAKSPTKRDLPRVETVTAKSATPKESGGRTTTWVWFGAAGVSVVFICGIVGYALWNRAPTPFVQSTVITVRKDPVANGGDKNKTDPKKKIAIAQPGDLVVSSDADHSDFQSLAEALEKSGPSRKIILAAKSADWDVNPLKIGEGKYVRCVHVHVTGENDTVTISTQTGEQPIFHVQRTPGFVLKNLTIDGNGRSAPLVVFDGESLTGCKLENVVFQNFTGDAVQLLGVRGASDAHLEIKNCRFYGSGGNAKGVVFASSEDLSASRQVTIENCRFVGCAAGIAVQGAVGSASARRNIFASGAVGVAFAPGSGATLLEEFRIENPTCWKMQIGIRIDDSPMNNGRIVISDGLFVDVMAPPVVAPPSVAAQLKATPELVRIDGLWANKQTPAPDPTKAVAVGPAPSIANVEFRETDAKKPDFLKPKQPVGDGKKLVGAVDPSGG